MFNVNEDLSEDCTSEILKEDFLPPDFDEESLIGMEEVILSSDEDEDLDEDSHPLNDAFIWCTVHYTYNCQCDNAIFFLKTNTICRCRDRLKTLSRKHVSKALSNADNFSRAHLHDRTAHSARTVGTHFNYTIRNKSPGFKTKRKLEIDYEILSNTNSLYKISIQQLRDVVKKEKNISSEPTVIAHDNKTELNGIIENPVHNDTFVQKSTSEILKEDFLPPDFDEESLIGMEEVILSSDEDEDSHPLNDAFIWCTVHYTYNCQCDNAIFFLKTNTICRCRDRLKTLSRKHVSKALSNADNFSRAHLHDRTAHSARTVGTHFNYTIRNKSPGFKTKRKLEIDYEILSNTNSLYKISIQQLRDVVKKEKNISSEPTVIAHDIKTELNGIIENPVHNDTFVQKSTSEILKEDFLPPDFDEESLIGMEEVILSSDEDEDSHPLNDAFIWCTVHYTYNCQCDNAIFFLKTNTICRCRDRLKTLSRKHVSKALSNADNFSRAHLHDRTAHSARTVGTHFNYTIRNKSPGFKTKRKLEIDYEILSNTNSLYKISIQQLRDVVKKEKNISSEPTVIAHDIKTELNGIIENPVHNDTFVQKSTSEILKEFFPLGVFYKSQNAYSFEKKTASGSLLNNDAPDLKSSINILDKEYSICIDYTTKTFKFGVVCLTPGFGYLPVREFTNEKISIRDPLVDYIYHNLKDLKAVNIWLNRFFKERLLFEDINYNLEWVVITPELMAKVKLFDKTLIFSGPKVVNKNGVLMDKNKFPDELNKEYSICIDYTTKTFKFGVVCLTPGFGYLPVREFTNEKISIRDPLVDYIYHNLKDLKAVNIWLNRFFKERLLFEDINYNLEWVVITPELMAKVKLFDKTLIFSGPKVVNKNGVLMDKNKFPDELNKANVLF